MTAPLTQADLDRLTARRTMTPTARTLSVLRAAGFFAEKVEQWIGPPSAPDSSAPAPSLNGNGDPGGDAGEHWDADAMPGRRPFKIRRDLYGIADVEAFRPGPTGVLYIQACAASGLADRIKRVLEAPKTAALVSDPNRRLQIWGWRLGGPRGERKVWRVTIVAVHPGPNGGCVAEPPVTGTARDVKHLLGGKQLLFFAGHTGPQMPRGSDAEVPA